MLALCWFRSRQLEASHTSEEGVNQVRKGTDIGDHMWRICLHPLLLASLFFQYMLMQLFSHDFEWKREECYILRKPDPAVLVAVTKEPPGRLQTRAVQILDYNLNR